MSEIGDELEHLRVPFEKIKFGKKIEGQGYGTVFEGEYDHRRVALKRLNITNLGHIKPKLLSEILTISRFRRHPNLVALLGFCDEKSNEIILVYEYVSSGNLADKMRKRLTTIQRLEICLGAARGLDYLHTGVDSTTSGIIHGDIKPSKILLNADSTSSKFEAKVSSFGLSKVLPGQVQKTQESTDPAYEVTGKVTKESDVYSFGVLLLEVLCGVSELVDTDDYQERHVTELVPKRLEQNRLRKIVHFDIRNEIKTESLDTYAKIACQCVMKNPEESPTMAQVVEELEKALRLQGGEVSSVQILGSRNGDGAPDGAVVDDNPKEDGKGVFIDSNTPENELTAVKIFTVEKNIDDLILDVVRENNGNENMSLDIPSESRFDEKNAAEDIITTQEQTVPVTVLDSEDGDNVPDKSHKTHVEDAQKESGNVVMVSTIDPEDPKQIMDNPNSNDKLNITGKNEADNETSSKPINDDNTTNQQEEQNLGILESGGTNGDELEHLRIPFEKIKFGKKIEGHGYGSVFEGEIDNRQIALKRINITNLNHIKPKILADVLTISRFRNHPNLVALVGFCDENSNEIVLVYEYVSCGNLADKMRQHLTTIQRLEICLGAARGLHYLHTGIDSTTPGIIHGNIKLSKILLNLDSTSSNFEAKVSGFGLSKVLPGHVLVSNVTCEVTKQSDVYCFGVLLLEVLCGVSEMVDTDDYQERSVTELVPKKLEQNTLRKIVQFDIRNEIKSESLDTYAKIACQCVMKSPDECPTMAQVIVELEKALRLQGEEVSDIQILGSSNDDGIYDETVDAERKEDGNNVKVDSNTPEKEPEVKIESIEENIYNLTSDDKIDFARENNDDEILENKIIDLSSKCSNGEENAAEDIKKQEPSFPVAILVGEDGNNVKGDAPIVSAYDPKSKEEIIDDLNSNRQSNFLDDKSRIDSTSDHFIEKNAAQITMEVHNSGTAGFGSTTSKSASLNLHDTEKKPELVIELREGSFDDFTTNDKLISIEKTQESESKRSSSSTTSESSNGDGTTPSDYLLHKSPPSDGTVKKQSSGSANCCSCGWWRFLSDRIASYGGLFWNKLVSFFTGSKGNSPTNTTKV